MHYEVLWNFLILIYINHYLYFINSRCRDVKISTQNSLPQLIHILNRNRPKTFYRRSAKMLNSYFMSYSIINRADFLTESIEKCCLLNFYHHLLWDKTIIFQICSKVRIWRLISFLRLYRNLWQIWHINLDNCK